MTPSLKLLDRGNDISQPPEIISSWIVPDSANRLLMLFFDQGTVIFVNVIEFSSTTHEALLTWFCLGNLLARLSDYMVQFLPIYILLFAAHFGIPQEKLTVTHCLPTLGNFIPPH
jgi:hypothetical protein